MVMDEIFVKEKGKFTHTEILMLPFNEFLEILNLYSNINNIERSKR